MIEPTLAQHLRSSAALGSLLAAYNGHPAVFSQSAPADNDPGWAEGPQYPRVIFAEDTQGDPERSMSGTLVVDVFCQENQGPFPEDIEPVLRELIHGWFFSSEGNTAAAQWRGSKYFTQITDHTMGVSLSFELLAFPLITTDVPDVVGRINEWTAARPGLVVINYDTLPAPAWKPTETLTAVYWRCASDKPAGWIPDTFSTVWREAGLRCHVFAVDLSTAASVSRQLAVGLYRDKRLLKTGEAPIMVNQDNRIDISADPLRTGQLSVSATYGVIIYNSTAGKFQHLIVEEREGGS